MFFIKKFLKFLGLYIIGFFFKICFYKIHFLLQIVVPINNLNIVFNHIIYILKYTLLNIYYPY